ncbi:hypothetical protein L596_016036 [Steinernema carpocapsae]|uniref:Fatty-acid and retinol-binding protein 1 n=1 Tax=Steinernema carpocapsae TaxID=34508 RepID=A0A4U5NI02_STECR|nr:hypothetical protein L596_016036 [Steinernema carpocapsae]
MFSYALVFALFGLIAAFPVPTNPRDKKFYDALPQEIQKFVQDLTEQDVEILNDLDKETDPKIRNDPSFNIAKAIELIKPKSESLYNRVKTLNDALMARINGLSSEPKSFMTQVLNKLFRFDTLPSDEQKIQEIVNILKGLKNMSPSSKQNLYQAFPIFQMVFEDQKFQKVFSDIENMTPAQIIQYNKQHGIKMDFGKRDFLGKQ